VDVLARRAADSVGAGCEECDAAALLGAPDRSRRATNVRNGMSPVRKGGRAGAALLAGHAHR
jgi:hypothetical protein